MKDSFKPQPPVTPPNTESAVQADAPGIRPAPVDDDTLQVIDIRKPWIDRRISLTIAILTLWILLIAGVGTLGFLDPTDFGDNTSNTAHAQVNGPLTQACQAYFIRNQKWPENLQVLLMRDATGTIYLENREALIDPWGKQYRYDPKGPMNQGLNPDIWTITPRGQIIGNWSKLNAKPR
jgi:hypothetical protein